MAINFPSSPTNGQKFVSGKVVYTYSTATGAWSTAPIGTALPFNYVVNPTFLISQQNGNSSSSTAMYHVADNWFGAVTAPGVISSSRAVYTSPNNSPYTLSSSCTTGNLAPAAGNYSQTWLQYFEGLRIADWGWGTANGKPIVVRFWLFSLDQFTIALTLRTSPSPYYSYVAPIVMGVGQLSSWVEYVIAVPPPPVSAVPTDNTLALQFGICMGAGTTFTAPSLNTWNSGNYIWGPGLTQATIFQATYRLADVGIYLDPLNTGRAPPWEAKDELTCMMEAQRYWYKCLTAQGGASAATQVSRFGHAHPVTMRASPALAVVGAPTVWDATANNAMGAINGNGQNFAVCEWNAAATGLTTGRGVVIASATQSIYIANNARV